MLSAGTNVEWLRDDLGHHRHRRRVATRSRAGCADTDGVVYVPALLGLGTPAWDYGARGTLLGLTRGTGRAAGRAGRARGRRPAGRRPRRRGRGRRAASPSPTLRVDGGMSDNPTFVQALADATGARSRSSPVLEATTLGAAFLAGLAVGTWGGLGRHRRHVGAATVVEPQGHARPGAVGAAPSTGPAGWYPELSGLDF